MTLGALDAAAWGSLAAWVGTVIAVASLAWQTRLSRKAQKDQAREAQEALAAQSRPFVVVDFDVVTERPFIFLTIGNLGKTLARNVQVRFDPPLSSALDAEHGTLAEVRLLTQGMPSLAPGKNIPILFDSFIGRGDDRPDAYEVTLTYDGDDDRHYEDTILLDLGVYRNMQYIKRHSVHDIHAELRQINATLKKWTSAYGALKVRSLQDEEKEHDEWNAAREERRRRHDDAVAGQSGTAKANGAPDPAA